MKRNLVLAFWIFGILFPMGWFIRVSPLGYRLFNDLFSPQWMHIFMHSLLFAVLGVLLMQRLSGTLARRVGLTLAFVLCAAILQEGFQLLSRQAVLHPDNLFDIGVDMLGGLLGVLAVLASRRLAEKWAGRHPALTR